MPYLCPVCGYPELPAPPRDYEICTSCGTEFEYHDARRSHSELRRMWIVQNAQWQSRVITTPEGWNPYVQMTNAGLPWEFPGVKISVSMQSNATIEQNETMRFNLHRLRVA